MQFNRVTTEKEAKDLIKIMPEIVAIDTEYVKGDPRTTQLLSVIIADSERAWAVHPSFLPVLTPSIKARKLIFLQDYDHCDTTILLKNGCDLRETNCHNLIDMHHLIDENAKHDLGSRILLAFNDNYKKEFWSKYKNFEDAPEDEALEYQCKDGIYTYSLGMSDLSQLTPCTIDTSKHELYEHVRQASAALFETQLNGLRVDVKLIDDTYSKMEYEINQYLPKLRSELNDYCEIWELGEWAKKVSKYKTESGRLGVSRPTFNFESTSQMSWLVYEAFGCPVITRTKSGAPSTDIDTLRTLSAGESRLRGIVEYKEVATLFNTFVKGMKERIDNGIIYPHFNVSGTSTGRISHSNPNMGNLPTTGVFRNFFIPREGMVLIGADYSQLEVVIEANLTEDPSLLKIINEGKSKHDITAEGLGIGRDSAKTLNFALQYGAGIGKVKKLLNVTQQEAEDIYERYWELYSGVRTLKEKVNKEIENTGQITNLAGRTRHFPKTTNKYELYKQQRQAYNFLIQGVAAECCNRAFYRFGKWLKDNNEGRALFSVHDEILCEVWGQNPQDPYFLMEELRHCMEQSSQDFNFKYPLKVETYGPLLKWSKE